MLENFPAKLLLPATENINDKNSFTIVLYSDIINILLNDITRST